MICNDCGLSKRANDFYKSRNTPTGRALICADCARNRARVTNQALAMLRDRHRDEYLAIRADLMSQPQAKMVPSD